MLNLRWNSDFPMYYFAEVLLTVPEGNEKEKEIF